jgi:hypothetical protein
MRRPASSPVAAPPKLKSVLVCHTSPAHDSSMTSRCLASSSPTSFKDALLGIRRDGEVRQAADGDQGWQLVTSKRTRRAVVCGAARDSALRHDRSARYLAKVQGRCFNCLSPHHLVVACRLPLPDQVLAFVFVLATSLLPAFAGSCLRLPLPPPHLGQISARAKLVWAVPLMTSLLSAIRLWHLCHPPLLAASSRPTRLPH